MSELFSRGAIPPCLDPLVQIISTCSVVAEKAKSVTINESAIDIVAAELCKDALSYREGVVWDYGGWHYAADTSTFGPVTCQYIFVMDALNFCFWPTKDLEYDHLAVGLRKVLEADITAFDAVRLTAMTEETLQSWFADFTLPLLGERVMRLRELGAALLEEYDGLAANMVRRAENSAARLVQLLLKSVPGFRDTAVYEGRLVHIYKRVQILVGDIWAAYGKATTKELPLLEGGTNPYYFHDLEKVTMFADYRIPQLLRNMGVMVYSEDLGRRVDAYEEILFGAHEEIEIRACTVIAVEKLKTVCNCILERNAAEAGTSMPRPLLSIELDWLLWNQGELCKDEIKPHHRTLTIYY